MFYHLEYVHGPHAWLCVWGGVEGLVASVVCFGHSSSVVCPCSFATTTVATTAVGTTATSCCLVVAVSVSSSFACSHGVRPHGLLAVHTADERGIGGRHILCRCSVVAETLCGSLGASARNTGASTPCSWRDHGGIRSATGGTTSGTRSAHGGSVTDKWESGA